MCYDHAIFLTVLTREGKYMFRKDILTPPLGIGMIFVNGSVSRKVKDYIWNHDERIYKVDLEEEDRRSAFNLKIEDMEKQLILEGWIA